MSNKINSGTASALNANETLLVRAITSSGDKIGFEFHEVINNGDAGMPGINLTHLANKSDTRFGIRSQKAWLYGEEQDMLDMFGQIIETLIPNDYQAEDLESRCKRKGADGDKILHQGNMIFRNANIIASVGDKAAANVFLAADKIPVTAQNAVNAFSDVEGLAI